jgi:hypothetical protein
MSEEFIKSVYRSASDAETEAYMQQLRMAYELYTPINWKIVQGQWMAVKAKKGN